MLPGFRMTNTTPLFNTIQGTGRTVDELQRALEAKRAEAVSIQAQADDLKRRLETMRDVSIQISKGTYSGNTTISVTFPDSLLTRSEALPEDLLIVLDVMLGEFRNLLLATLLRELRGLNR